MYGSESLLIDGGGKCFIRSLLFIVTASFLVGEKGQVGLANFTFGDCRLIILCLGWRNDMIWVCKVLNFQPFLAFLPLHVHHDVTR